ncbi:hypothetical protein [Streptomyces sp. DW26H14]|uniref:hypothetical protein n=1 Tax=Streptomyces sp. DW26H14 TaxID=3435395 RepID=UPI00403E3561
MVGVRVPRDRAVGEGRVHSVADGLDHARHVARGPAGQRAYGQLARGRAATAAHTARAKAHARDEDGCESGSGAGSGVRTGTVYDFWHGHIAALLTEARPGPDADADALAHLLLGPLASDHVQRLLASGDDGRERIAAAWRALLDGVLPDGSGRADDHDRPRARPRG